MKWLKKFGRQAGAETPFCTAVVPAAGKSERMGGENKLLLPLDGIPVLIRTLLALDEAGSISEIVVATRESDLVPVSELIRSFALSKSIKLVCGGETRTQSVYNACLEASPEARLIAVHDGARPLVTAELIDRTVEKAAVCAAAAPGLPVKDTVKVARERLITATPDRSTLFFVQTPQVFDAALLKAALQAALEQKLNLTDDCACVERMGKQIYLTEGDEENLKITTPLDIRIAEAILEGRENRGL